MRAQDWSADNRRGQVPRRPSYLKQWLVLQGPAPPQVDRHRPVVTERATSSQCAMMAFNRRPTNKPLRRRPCTYHAKSKEPVFGSWGCTGCERNPRRSAKCTVDVQRPSPLPRPGRTAWSNSSPHNEAADIEPVQDADQPRQTSQQRLSSVRVCTSWITS